MNWPLRYAMGKLRRCPWCGGAGDDLKSNVRIAGKFNPQTGKGMPRPTNPGQWPGNEDVMTPEMVDDHNEHCGVDRECTPATCGVHKLFSDAEQGIQNVAAAAKQSKDGKEFGTKIDPLNRALIQGRHSGAQQRSIVPFQQDNYSEEELGDICTEHGCTATKEPWQWQDKSGFTLNIAHNDSCPNKVLGPRSSSMHRGGCIWCGEDIKPDEQSIRWKNPTSQDNSFANPNKPGNPYIKLTNRFTEASKLKDIDSWQDRLNAHQDNLRAADISQRPFGSSPQTQYVSTPSTTGGTPIVRGPNGGLMQGNGTMEDTTGLLPFHVKCADTDTLKALRSQCPAHQGKASSDYEVGYGGGIHFTNLQGEQPCKGLLSDWSKE